MKNHNKIIILIILLFSLLLCISCDDEITEKEDKVRLENMEQEILDLVSDLSCTDSTDCRYIGFGAKPCGGFWKYIIYSITNVDSDQLTEKVRIYNEYNETLNAKYGWISDCSLPRIPIIRCRDGECVNIIEY